MYLIFTVGAVLAGAGGFGVGYAMSNGNGKAAAFSLISFLAGIAMMSFVSLR